MITDSLETGRKRDKDFRLGCNFLRDTPALISSHCYLKGNTNSNKLKNTVSNISMRFFGSFTLYWLIIMIFWEYKNNSSKENRSPSLLNHLYSAEERYLETFGTRDLFFIKQPNICLPIRQRYLPKHSLPDWVNSSQKFLILLRWNSKHFRGTVILKWLCA